LILTVLLLNALDADGDIELLESARKGNRDAFGRLVRKYEKRVFRVARRMCMNDDDAWDITQDAFIRAMQAMEGFDTRYRFFTWMYRIVTNLAINLSEKRKRRGEVLFDEEYGADGRQSIPDNAVEIAHTNQLAAAIREAVTDLSPPLRAVFVLRVDSELSYSEIAETLDIAIGTVMSRLNRARGQVRSAVGYLLGGEPE
jgi:RNA polymerase sigma-70 factor (ECF subfamily)